MPAQVKFNHRHKPVPAPAPAGANRIGKTRRPFGEPVAFLKSTPMFEAVPFNPQPGNLVLPLSTISKGVNDAVEKAKTLVFHSVGDTGGVNGTEAQDAISKEMEQQIKN